MRHISILIIVTALGLAACGSGQNAAQEIDPYRLEDIEGSDLQRVILTEKAVERIGVETVSITGLVVPYSAVIYDVEGNAWVYTNPKPLTFVRARVIIDRIEGDQAFLLEGTQTDAPIVTVGAAEIYGAETGVSK